MPQDCCSNDGCTELDSGSGGSTCHIDVGNNCKMESLSLSLFLCISGPPALGSSKIFGLPPGRFASLLSSAPDNLQST